MTFPAPSAALICTLHSSHFGASGSWRATQLPSSLAPVPVQRNGVFVCLLARTSTFDAQFICGSSRIACTSAFGFVKRTPRLSQFVARACPKPHFSEPVLIYHLPVQGTGATNHRSYRPESLITDNLSNSFCHEADPGSCEHVNTHSG